MSRDDTFLMFVVGGLLLVGGALIIWSTLNENDKERIFKMLTSKFWGDFPVVEKVDFNKPDLLN